MAITDNSVALWCLQRMFSASPPLNGILRKIAAHMREKDVSLEAVFYVPSRLNPADGPSRHRLNEAEAEAIVAASRRLLCGVGW